MKKTIGIYLIAIAMIFTYSFGMTGEKAYAYGYGQIPTFNTITIDKTEVQAGDSVTYYFHVATSSDSCTMENQGIFYIVNNTVTKGPFTATAIKNEGVAAEYTATVQTDATWQNGTWSITTARFFDSGMNNTEIKQYYDSHDKAEISFTLSGGVENVSPEIENITVDKNETCPGTKVKYTLKAKDESGFDETPGKSKICLMGLKKTDFWYADLGYQKDVELNYMGQKDGYGIFEGEYEFPSDADLVMYYVKRLYIYDKYGNCGHGLGSYDATNIYYETDFKDARVTVYAHDWNEGTVTEEPTCAKPGTKTATCQRCGLTSDTVEIPVLDHTWKYVVVTPATFTKEGSVNMKCSNCGVEYGPYEYPYAKEIKIQRTAYTYNGKSQNPAVTAVDSYNNPINSGYTVTYLNSKNVGTATARIVFSGMIEGTKDLTYTISPKGTTIKKPKRMKKAVKVKWKKQTAKMAAQRITGYQIQVARDSAFTKNVKTVNVKGFNKKSKKIKKLKAKKKYFVRVRTYMNVKGKTYYSGWSAVKKVKTK